MQLYLPRLAVVPVAALPAASSLPGALRAYGGSVYYSDGSNWIALGSGGGNVPIDIQNGTYAFVAGDVGRCKAKNNTTAYTYTLNNSIFSAGDWFSIANLSSTANITIARGTGVTLYYAGSTSNANRTVFPRGMATIYMESASVGYIYGNGVS